jgi:DNA-binding NarL/FixJ family response regulator
LLSGLQQNIGISDKVARLGSRCIGIDSHQQVDFMSVGKIRVLLADDHAIVRKGLTRLINLEPDIKVVGEACNGRQAIELTKSIMPEIVIMDMSMPDIDGVTATRIIRNNFPQIQVIALSMSDAADAANRMLGAGAVKYLSKATPACAILSAIRQAAKREAATA